MHEWSQGICLQTCNFSSFSALEGGLGASLWVTGRRLALPSALSSSPGTPSSTEMQEQQQQQNWKANWTNIHFHSHKVDRKIAKEEILEK